MLGCAPWEKVRHLADKVRHFACHHLSPRFLTNCQEDLRLFSCLSVGSCQESNGIFNPQWQRNLSFVNGYAIGSVLWSFKLACWTSQVFHRDWAPWVLNFSWHPGPCCHFGHWFCQANNTCFWCCIICLSGIAFNTNYRAHIYNWAWPLFQHNSLDRFGKIKGGFEIYLYDHILLFLSHTHQQRVSCNPRIIY